MMKRLLLLCFVALVAVTASATLLTPGTSGVPNAIPTALPAYTFLATTGSVAFAGTNVFNQTKFTGDLETSVWRDNASGNVFFTYQFVVLTGGFVGKLTTTDFTGVSTDVSYSTYYGCATVLCGAGTLVAPGSSFRSPDGSEIGFDFSGLPGFGVHVGQETYDMWVFTNAKNYTSGSVSLIDGGTANIVGYAPSVPEPASLTLLASGLVLFGIRRFRK